MLVAAQVIPRIQRSMRVFRRNFLKKYRVFLPLSSAAHRVSFSIKMFNLRREVRNHTAWSTTTKFVVFSGIPKAASMAVNAQLTETFGDFFQGGNYLYARDLAELKRGVQHSNSRAKRPAIVGIGHQSPSVLIESGLIAESDARSVPLVCIIRPDDERFLSGLRYCYSQSLLPSSLGESEFKNMLEKRGFASLRFHDTSLNWGIPIHFSPNSYWLREGLKFNLQTFDIQEVEAAVAYICRFLGLPQTPPRVPTKNSTQAK